MAELTMYVNCSATDSSLQTSGVDWVEFSEGNDELIFTGGSTDVADGQPIPSQNDLIQAGIRLTGSQIIVDTYLLSDISANLLKSIDNMGNTNKRYVLAFDFDDATASEPTLEVWDDDTLTTIDSTILGSGSATQSFVVGVTTTNGLPGSNWTGSKLAGSSAGHFLYLNDQNGPLSVAGTLYANIKIIIPASQTTGFSANPVFVCKFLSN